MKFTPAKGYSHVTEYERPKGQGGILLPDSVRFYNVVTILASSTYEKGQHVLMRTGAKAPHLPDGAGIVVSDDDIIGWFDE